MPMKPSPRAEAPEEAPEEVEVEVRGAKGMGEAEEAVVGVEVVEEAEVDGSTIRGMKRTAGGKIGEIEPVGIGRLGDGRQAHTTLCPQIGYVFLRLGDDILCAMRSKSATRVGVGRSVSCGVCRWCRFWCSLAGRSGWYLRAVRGVCVLALAGRAGGSSTRLGC